MNIRKILWVLALVLFRMTLAQAQNSDNARVLTEETLRVNASSASVLQWLSKIEADLGIVISYNPAQVDVNKVVGISRPGVYTVGSLLTKVLDGYKVRTAFVPPRKLLLQIEKIENFCVSGTVLEEESAFTGRWSVCLTMAESVLPPLPMPTAFIAFMSGRALMCSAFRIWDMYRQAGI